jgi:glutathione peroxidase
MKDIDGKDVKLSKFKGKAIMVVNVASQCGNTPQYKALESLYEKYSKQGFVVLGFPANEFGGQEPGSNTEIKEFCKSNYKVTFPMFSKIVVKGAETNELYRWLVAQSGNNNEVEWNFAKFIVDRHGKVANRFDPRTKPDDKKIISAVEAALKTK